MPNTRIALLAAAQSSFAAQGFTGTSIRALTSSVGIKESSFYNHFPSKQALLVAVMKQAEERLSAVADAFQISIDDPIAAAPTYANITLENLEHIAQGFLDMWLEDPDFIAAQRILTIEQYRTPQAGELLRKLMIERPLAFQTTLFTKLINEKLFRPVDPAALALAFWGPILTILISSDSPEHKPRAQQQLHLHLQHFHATYVLDEHKH